MRDHRKLRAFTSIDDFVLRVYESTSGFPRHEMFGLTQQLRRAAVSAASNIVEGCSRSSQRDFVRFLEIAHGSLREAGYQLSLAFRLNYIVEGDYRVLHNSYQKSAKSLASLINKVRNELSE